MHTGISRRTPHDIKELAIGSTFRFKGRVFTKTALALAEDEQRWGTIFLYETEVEPLETPAADRSETQDLTA